MFALVVHYQINKEHQFIDVLDGFVFQYLSIQSVLLSSVVPFGLIVAQLSKCTVRQSAKATHHLF